MRALLIIDLLEDYFQSGPLRELRPALVGSVNTLIDYARAQGCPIIWVRQEFRSDLSDAFPVMREQGIRLTIAGTPGCEVLSELQRCPEDLEVVKKRYSAFFGTSLEATLNSMGVNDLVIAGINTHACVRTAAIDAYQRDLKVTIPVDCVASYDHEHHAITLEYLGRHIARVVELEVLLAEAW